MVKSSDPGLCDVTYVSNPQIALIDLLTSVGLKPDGIIGHSLGEVACGYADGCLSQREAVLAAYWRGQCIKDARLPAGSMAAVGRYPLWAPTSGTRIFLKGFLFWVLQNNQLPPWRKKCGYKGPGHCSNYIYRRLQFF